MKNIGLFFGSFNPIHLGHLAVAEFFAQNTSLEEVWLVVSPQSPFKEKNTLMENHHRLAMVQLAIDNKSNLRACAEEFDLPSPNYTIDTLNHLKKRYPQYKFRPLERVPPNLRTISALCLSTEPVRQNTGNTFKSF